MEEGKEGLEEQLFAALLDCSDPGRRREILDQQCNGDEALKRRVEALLEADTPTNKWLQRDRDTVAELSTVAKDSLDFDLRRGIDDFDGRFRLLESIGEGGFGAVYRAEQLFPVRREVALKLIKPGMDSRRVVARFEQERQTLAMMDHPNIARVLDAGSTAFGRPYFVMEFVPGKRITVMNAAWGFRRDASCCGSALHLRLFGMSAFRRTDGASPPRDTPARLKSANRNPAMRSSCCAPDPRPFETFTSRVMGVGSWPVALMARAASGVASPRNGSLHGSTPESEPHGLPPRLESSSSLWRIAKLGLAHCATSNLRKPRMTTSNVNNTGLTPLAFPARFFRCRTHGRKAASAIQDSRGVLEVWNGREFAASPLHTHL